jgi:serine/threonine-protein kinase
LSFRHFFLRLLKRAAFAVALFATAVLSAVLTMSAILSSREVQVPSLLGRRMGDASGVAGRQQLLVKLEGRRYDPRVPLDHVAAQDPPPGAVLKTHRTVRLWLSMGPQRLDVPAVEGESLRAARLKLEQTGLPVEHVVEVDDAAPEGTVIVQRPPPGEADEIRAVALLVSRGAAGIDYVMPDLIGKPAGDVIDTLRRAGLRVADVRYRTYPGVEPGIVLRQTPPAGYRVNLRSTVALDVSKAS